jgi:hypothetical protein
VPEEARRNQAQARFFTLVAATTQFEYEVPLCPATWVFEKLAQTWRAVFALVAAFAIALTQLENGMPG